jgi:serine/threonine-protein kinase
MDSDRWSRLVQIFEQATELTDEARQAYLDRACAGDDQLRTEVEALLAHDTEATDTLAAGVREAMGDVLDSSTKDLKSTLVGPYRLVEQIGSGGMGTVWRAVRDDDVYTKQVAVKLMHRGLHDPELRARFASERQILASLEHPFIARLIDGGTTGAGVPYVVMEHVEGRPISRYCDEERLSIEQRLELFRMVCDAISFAHRNLVVHRDLKPANILVTAEGVPKLLDFGIAKLLDPSASPHAPAETRPEMRLLTPEYASPEQVRGDPVTTASDVYASGVLLYELLTGHRPYVLSGSGARELEQVICEQQPDRPSTAVTREPDDTSTASPEHTTVESIGRARRAEPAQLRKELHGDLDNIILKALRKEPDQRYASADQLSEDIRRHLVGLPVMARPATWGYRAGKFLSRHRLGAATTAAVTVLVVALVGFYTLRLQQERSRAEEEARTNARVTEFLLDLFKGANPYEVHGEPVSAREILDRGAERIRTGLSDDPAIQVRLLETMARAYRGLSEYEAALGLADSALDLQQELDEVPPAKRSDLLGLRGGLLTSLARYDEAREELEQALQAAGEAYGPIHERNVLLRNAIAIVIEYEGDWEEAEGRYLENLELASQLPDAPDTVAAADTHNLLARLYTKLGQHEKAIEYSAECIRIRDQTLDANDPQRRVCIGLLGSAYREKGDHDAAEPLLLEDVGLCRKLLGDRSFETSMALNNLASLYKMRGEPERALPLVEESNRIQRDLLGEDHPQVAITLNNLANVLQDLGRVEESLVPQRQALAINRAALGDEHPSVATNLNNLAAKLRDLGQYEEAEEMYRLTLEIDLKTLGDRHPYIGMDWCNLAMLYKMLERYDEAEPLLRKALELQDGNPDISAVNLAATLTHLGDLLALTDRLDQAEPMLRRAVAVREEAIAPDSIDLARSRHLLGRAWLKQGRLDEAREIMERSYEIFRQKPAGDLGRRLATERMVELYEALQDEEKASALRAELR